MDIRPHPVKPPIERFLALVDVIPGACWPWKGSKSKDGYGQFVLSACRGEKRIRIAPYRFIWEHFNGPMPEGLEPDHTCNNRKCCNPEHIEPVTHSENQKRSYQRGRARLRTVPVPSQCIHGHEYTPANKRINSQGGIVCRTCDRARSAAYQARKRAARPPKRISYPSMLTS